MKAISIVEQYNKKYKKNEEVVTPVVPKLSTADLVAKSIVESLVENKFSVDIPTRKDAISELMRLAESRSPVAERMMQFLDDITAGCKVNEDGYIEVDLTNVKERY